MYVAAPADFPHQRGSPGVSRLAWLVVAVLVPVSLLNHLDRQMLAAMKPSIMADIPDIAPRANREIVLGSCEWVYAILSPLGGHVADRTSRRLVIVASLFVWSAVTLGDWRPAGVWCGRGRTPAKPAVSSSRGRLHAPGDHRLGGE